MSSGTDGSLDKTGNSFRRLGRRLIIIRILTVTQLFLCKHSKTQDQTTKNFLSDLKSTMS